MNNLADLEETEREIIERIGRDITIGGNIATTTSRSRSTASGATSTPRKHDQLAENTRFWMFMARWQAIRMDSILTRLADRFSLSHSSIPTIYMLMSCSHQEGQADREAESTATPWGVSAIPCGSLGICLVVFTDIHLDSPYVPTSRAYGLLR